MAASERDQKQPNGHRKEERVRVTISRSESGGKTKDARTCVDERDWEWGKGGKQGMDEKHLSVHVLYT
jgi:hypothetical protein